jgi:hypothetical protein
MACGKVQCIHHCSGHDAATQRLSSNQRDKYELKASPTLCQPVMDMLGSDSSKGSCCNGHCCGQMSTVSLTTITNMGDYNAKPPPFVKPLQPPSTLRKDRRGPCARLL